MPIARLFVERYKKRHQAAQVRSANGLRGIFKFSEILSSPSYAFQILGQLQDVTANEASPI